jgi:ATP-dependent exoDNAse (exonuclease V) beta subunit
VLIDPELGVLPELSEERIEGEEDAETTQVRSAVYQVAQWSASDQEEAESDRLLYVAATRAKEMLLVSGAVSRGLPGWLARLDSALALKEGLSSVKEESERMQILDLDAAGEPVACRVWPEGADPPLTVATSLAGQPDVQTELPATPPLLPPLMAEPVTVDQEARDAAADPPQRVWRVVPRGSSAWAPAWVVGKIVHRALEHWAFPGSAAGRDWYAWAASEAGSCGITDDSQALDAVRRAARTLARFQATPLCAEMAGAERRLHEVPYAVSDAEGRLEQGTIDALYWSGGECTLVEFKTDRIQNEADLEETLEDEDYVKQVARYLDAVERTLGVRPRPVLCLLNYRGTVHLVEDRW